MNEINKKEFKVGVDLFVKTVTSKKRVILTDSLRGSIKESFDFYKIKKHIPHYSIDRNGVIYQHINPLYYNEYYTDKKINTDSIIISMVNCSWVTYKNSDNKYYNWDFEEVEINDVVEISWNNNRYWQTYTTLQTQSLVELCKMLNETHNINLNAIFDNIYTPSCSLFSGVICESNLYKWSNSLNPTFDFNYLRLGFS